MRRLFIEKAIIIDAHISEVWKVLTDPQLSKQWIQEWWPELETLESDWRPGSPVVWKLKDGQTGADGKVTIADPYTMLSFSFRANEPNTDKQEIITYKLEERENHTYLLVTVGDFGDTPDHELCYPGAVESWDRSLPKIKALSEK